MPVETIKTHKNGMYVITLEIPGVKSGLLKTPTSKDIWLQNAEIIVRYRNDKARHELTQEDKTKGWHLHKISVPTNEYNVYESKIVIDKDQIIVKIPTWEVWLDANLDRKTLKAIEHISGTATPNNVYSILQECIGKVIKEREL